MTGQHYQPERPPLRTRANNLVARILLQSPRGFQPIWDRVNRASLYGMGLGAAKLPLTQSGDAYALSLANTILRSCPPHEHSRVAIDVGANRGDWAILALATLGPDARIWCFEPSPSTFKSLKHALAADSRVTLVRSGCAARPGRATLFELTGHSELSSIYRNSFQYQGGSDRLQPDTESDISLVDLDSYLGDQNIAHIDFLKVDTEGTEHSVLLGASDTISSRNATFIQFEFGARNAAAHTLLMDFYELLGPNYVIYRLSGRGMTKLHPYHPRQEHFFSATNYLAVLTDLVGAVDSAVM